ncbi:PAS domain S-box protein [Parasediminibacterium sp. JCM 36343]|uniref:PAS domain S-box protein n=1 Tax=Parasediminibacterium sp. JCM 36343 TaxID=3374279 RepID=UPI00397C237C
MENTYLQQNLTAIFTQLPIAICILNGPDFTIAMANDKALELWGKTKEEVMNKPTFQVFPELEAQGFLDILNGVYTTGKHFISSENPVKLIRNDNIKEIFVHFEYNPIYGTDGRITGIIGTSIDNTAQIEAKKKIEQSEQQLKIALEGGELGTFDYSPLTNELNWSGKTKEFFGLPEDAPVSYDLYVKAIHPQDRINSKAILAKYEKDMQRNGLYELEYRAIGIKDGKIRWLRSKGKVTHDEGGKPIRYTGILQDISKQKEAEDALKESENEFRQLADLLPALVWTTDSKGQQTFASKRWKEFTGLDPCDASTFEKMVHPDDLPEIIKTWTHCLGTGKPYKTYCRLKNKNDEYEWFYVNGEAIKNDNGDIEKWIGTFTNINEQKKVEEYLTTALRKVAESEERSRLAIEAADLGTFDWNLLTQEFISSQRLNDIFGYQFESKITHEQLVAAFHPEDITIRNKAVSMAPEKGSLIYEARTIWPDKSIHWARVYGKIIYDANNVAQRMYGTVMDITERRMVEKELEEKVIARTLELKKSEETIFRMVNEVQDYAILLLSKEGIIENWNKGAQKIKGYTSDEIIGKHFSIFYNSHDLEASVPNELLKKAATVGKASDEGWRVKKDGSLFWASVALTALHDQENNIIGFSKVTRDLTQKKIAEQELEAKSADLEKANLALEKSNSELEQFAYVASHDLQEPLRKIQFFIERLRIALPTTDTNAILYFDKIKNSTMRMNTLINDLLDFSRLSSMNEQYVTVDLNAVLQNIKTDFELMILQKNATVTVSALPTIDAIPLQMQQLFYNLVSNALKFSKESVPPVISVGCGRLTEAEIAASHPNLDPNLSYYCIQVKDNGIGFDQQYAEKIFVIFLRLNDFYTYGGTGIGLALCKKIMINHHGDIYARSVENEGSSFYVVIPEKQS